MISCVLSQWLLLATPVMVLVNTTHQETVDDVLTETVEFVVVRVSVEFAPESVNVSADRRTVPLQDPPA